MSIKAGLCSFLNARAGLAAIVGTRIFPSLVPQVDPPADNYPAITFVKISEPNKHSLKPNMTLSTSIGAVSAFSTVLQLSNGSGTPTYTNLSEIRSIGDVGGERDMIDVTHMESVGMFKEFIAGLMDSLMLSLELNYLPQDS